MEWCMSRYGSCFKVRLPSVGDLVLVADRDAIREIFTKDPALVCAGEANAYLEPLVGARGTYLLDREDHLHHRRKLLPALHGEHVRRYEDMIAEITERELRRWPAARPLRLVPRLRLVCFEVLLGVLFGPDPSRRLEDLRAPLRHIVDASVRRPRTFMLPGLRRDLGRWSPAARLRRARDRAHDLLGEEIASRRRHPGKQSREDVLSRLVQWSDGDRGLTDDEISTELLTSLLAGYEPMSRALPAAVERLVSHPPVLARLESEIERGGDEYLDAVVLEALRLDPGRTVAPRRLAAPLAVDGHTLPAGAFVAPCIYLTHRLPEIYSQPKAFRPSRFLDRDPDTYAWIPFGGGTRRCAGASLTLLQMRTLISTLVRSRRLRRASFKARLRRGGATLS
jgi:cytochrome P450 family 135